MILHPYKRGSQSAKALARALGAKIIKATGPKLKNKLLLNWGSSKHSERVGAGCEYVNHPFNVGFATNKLVAFDIFSQRGVTHVPWTKDKKVAQDWKEKGNIVLARAVLKGHSGDGISIIRANDALPDVPLYTLYVKKNAEYRIHVFKDQVIDIQQKKRQNGAQPHLIRSHKNGYVFCREGVVCPDEAKDLARAAVNSLGLHFGAVDIIQGKDGKFYCCEVNTAPGIEGQTVESYANAIKSSL